MSESEESYIHAYKYKEGSDEVLLADGSLEEVVDCLVFLLRLLHGLVRSVLFILRSSHKGVEMFRAPWPDFQYRRHIATAITIIRRTPNRRQLVIVQNTEPLHAQLMRTQNVVHVVPLQEMIDDGRAESVPCAPGRDCEFFFVRIGIGPDQVGHGTFVWDFSEAVDDFDLVYVVD